MINGLSFNLEDYVDSYAARTLLSEQARIDQPRRIEKGVLWVLDALRETRTHATFFVPGCVAEGYPDLIRRISEAGHEIAAHPMNSDPLSSISPDQFEKQLQQSKRLIEDVSGQRVVGFRAPDFSLMTETLWVLDILIQLGFEYDSSIIPVRHEAFGIPTARPGIHHKRTLEGKQILEFPPLTVGKRHRFPVGACPYLRFYPARWVHQLIRKRNRQGEPILLSFHTWEFDPHQPQLPLSRRSRWMQTWNLRGARLKLNYYLRHRKWTTLRETIEHAMPIDDPPSQHSGPVAGSPETTDR